MQWINPEQIVQSSLVQFARFMLRDLFYDEPAPFQLKLGRALDEALDGGQRLVGALPREHGKTTLGTVALAVREACRCWAANRAQPAAADDRQPERGASGEAWLRVPQDGADAAASWTAADRCSLAAPPKRHILIIGANQQEARAKLRLILQELETNQLVNEYFPGIAQPAKGKNGRNIAYRSSEAVLACGLRLAAFGVNNALRGQLHNGQRPDLVLLDDPEDDSGTSSQLRRQKLRTWCERALLPVLDNRRGSLVWLGTLLHHDSVLAQWILEHGGVRVDSGAAEDGPAAADGQGAPAQSTAAQEQAAADGAVAIPGLAVNPAPASRLAAWRVLYLPALDEDGSVLWPGRWSAARLEQRRLEIGDSAFNQEYLLRPASEESRRFRAGDFATYSAADELRCVDGEFTIHGCKLQVAIGVDPAVGAREQNDWFAAAVVGFCRPPGSDRPGAPPGQPAFFKAYVLEIARIKGRFSEQLDLLKDLQRRYNARVVGIEQAGYQAVLSQAAADHGLPAQELPPQGSKAWRVENVSVAAARGALWLPGDQPWVAEFRREAYAWPGGRNDDQLDALAYALKCGLELLERARRGPYLVLGVRGGDWSRDDRADEDDGWFRPRAA